MLIVSKFRDYYDSVAGTMGIDKKLVYKRNSLELNYKYPDFFYRIQHCCPYISKLFKSVRVFVVGFCGKTYVGFDFDLGNDKKLITYDIELVKELFELHDKTKKNTLNNFNNYYSEILKINYDEVYRKHNTPVFIISSDYNNHNTYMTINGKLSDYEFYKVFNSFDAFQEIGMFIGGVLVSSENTIINISDSDRIKQYGFDKYSFRKEKNNE